jgi:hypothetical protein
MKIYKFYDKYIAKMLDFLQGDISNTIVYIIGVIVLAVINSGIAFVVKELYYFPDILFGLKVTVFNLTIFYLLVYIIWKIVIKYINDLF